jgi:hypothetical protein
MDLRRCPFFPLPRRGMCVPWHADRAGCPSIRQGPDRVSVSPRTAQRIAISASLPANATGSPGRARDGRTSVVCVDARRSLGLWPEVLGVAIFYVVYISVGGVVRCHALVALVLGSYGCGSGLLLQL